MEIFRSSNTFSPIGTNLSRTDCTFHIFNKIKDTFTEIVVKDQKCGRNTCSCQKRNKDAFYDRFCSVDNGKASQYIGDLIHKDIKEQ